MQQPELRDETLPQTGHSSTHQHLSSHLAQAKVSDSHVVAAIWPRQVGQTDRGKASAHFQPGSDAQSEPDSDAESQLNEIAGPAAPDVLKANLLPLMPLLTHAPGAPTAG